MRFNSVLGHQIQRYSMKQVIVLRTDLNMRKGKMVAQGAHASMAAIINYNGEVINSQDVKNWLDNSFTKVVVGVHGEDELLYIHHIALISGFPCSLIRDNGKTEFNGMQTYTAVAVGPGPVEEIDKITGHLKLL